MRLSTWLSGVAVVTVDAIAPSMYLDCTSRSSNCFSNLSMSAEICTRFIERMAESMDLTTPFIDAVTCSAGRVSS